jgi:hypothetical protein
LSFIKKARVLMSKEDVATAEALLYHKGDVDFLGQI